LIPIGPWWRRQGAGVVGRRPQCVAAAFPKCMRAGRGASGEATLHTKVAA
jgi:hypothetical protein